MEPTEEEENVVNEEDNSENVSIETFQVMESEPKPPSVEVDGTKARSRQPQMKSGWIEKRGGGTSAFGRKNWKTRYFVLQSGELFYFESDASKTPLKSILLHLSDAADRYEDLGKYDPKHKYQFKLVTLKRTLFMCAENEEDQIGWINELKIHISNSSDYTLADRI